MSLDDYEAKYAQQYERGRFETRLVEIRRRTILESMGPLPMSRVLEVGCGLEPLFMHRPVEESHTVVEPSRRFANHARRLGEGRANVAVFERRIEDVWPELTPGFSFIVVSSLLHEVAQPARVLDAVRGLCNDHTVVHVNVPNARSFHRLLALEMGLITDVFERSPMDEYFGRHSRFDIRTLTDLVERQGFRVIRSGTYFVKPFTNDQMDRLLEAAIIDVSVIRGLEGMIKYMPDLGNELYLDLQSG